MESNRIEILIEKYFQGETSIEEENELKEYFSSSKISPNLEQYTSVFNYFSNEKHQIFEPILELKSRNRNSKWMAIAASIIVFLGIGIYTYFSIGNSNQNQDLGTFDNPEAAFIETQKALSILSSNINIGYGGMNYIKEYDYSKNLIFKQK
jgi:hypothetical protein